MKTLDFDFGPLPWETALNALPRGGSIDAVELLTLMEGEQESDLEEAFELLEQRGISVDAGRLQWEGGAELTARLRQERLMARNDLSPENMDSADPLAVYLQELAAIPVCGDPELLAQEMRLGREDAKSMLMNLSLSRVVQIAREYAGRGVLLLDLIQEGSLGLWQGLERYADGDFEEFRDWWIRQYMTRELVRQARSGGVGQKMRRAAEDYRSVDEKLLTELGRNPTLEEMAEGLHMSVEETLQVRALLDSARVVQRAHAPRQPEQPEEEEDQAVEDTALFRSRQRIQELLSGLSPEDAMLLSLRFGLEGGLPLSVEDVGRRLGLAPDQVVAREAAALASLRGE